MTTGNVTIKKAPATVAADPLRGRDMLCFSHDWNGDPLSKTHLMRLMARENRVLWVNSIGYRTPTASKADLRRAFWKLAAAASPLREVEPNIFTLNPLAIPAYGNSSVRAFNRGFLRWQVKRAMRRLRFKQVINWVFNPAASVIAGELGEEMVIYRAFFDRVAGGDRQGDDRRLIAQTPAQRPSARAQAIQRAPRVLQRFRRRVDAVSRQRADIEREPAQGARISGGGFTSGFDRDS
jgi:hypothetical protein